jgi:hypothetical protein
VTIRSWFLVLLSVSALSLVACSSSDNGSTDTDDDAAPDQVTWPDASPDTATDVAPEAAEPAPEATEPGDVAEPSPDVVEPVPDVAPEDVAPEIEPPPDPPVVTPGANCTPGSGAPVTLYDLRDPACPRYPGNFPTSTPGLPVTFEGLVVTANFVGSTKDTMFVQEEEGGPYSGIAIYKGGQLLPDLFVGDRVDVEGEVTDFFGQLQVQISGNGGSVEKVGDGAPPVPFDIPHPSHVATDGAVAEAFEGVLVRVHDLKVLNTRPDCPQEWGEFSVEGDPWVPGFLGLRVDDMGDWTYAPGVGDELATITGPLAFTWDNTKLEPRDDADLAVTLKGAGGQTKCVNTGCLVATYDAGTDTYTPGAESGTLVISEIQYNPASADTTSEWFELYNPGGAAVELAGWKLSDCGLLPNFSFVFEGGTVPAHGVLVVGNSTDPALNGDADVDLAYGDAFPLPNTVGTLLLHDANGTLVDQVGYSRFEPWEAEASHSIELEAPGLDNTKATSWSVAEKKYGDAGSYGTPGKVTW